MIPSIVGVCLLWAGVVWRDDGSTDQPQMQSHEAKHVYAHLLNKSQIDSLATSQHTNTIQIIQQRLVLLVPGVEELHSRLIHAGPFHWLLCPKDCHCWCSLSLQFFCLYKVSAIVIALSTCFDVVEVPGKHSRISTEWKVAITLFDRLRFCPPHDVWLWFKGHPEPVRPRPPFRSSRQWFGDLVRNLELRCLLLYLGCHIFTMRY